MLISISVLLLYVLIRFIIYEHFTVASFEGWVQRDWIMNLPRMICFFLLLIFGFEFQEERKKLLPNSEGMKLSIVMGIILCGTLLVRSFWLDIQTYSYDIVTKLVIGSIVVGFFEETLFRGCIFSSLRKVLGPMPAVIGSAVLFMVFHFQAQSFVEFPLILLLGVLFAMLKMDGVSLFWLSILHATYDILVFLWIPSSDAIVFWKIFECLIIICVVASYVSRRPLRRYSTIKD